MNIIRVIIIEDEKEVREGLRYLISIDSQLKVTTTYASAEEALKDLEINSAVDILLMDIGLPGMNGIEATRIIRRKYPHIKVVMLTVFEEKERIMKAIRSGASGYILKNTRPEQLVEQLKSMRMGGSPLSPEAAGTLISEFQQGMDDLPAEEYHLTPREKEILKDIAEGQTYREIALINNISSATAKKHILHIYRKLNVNSKVEFLKKVIRENLI